MYIIYTFCNCVMRMCSLWGTVSPSVPNGELHVWYSFLDKMLQSELKCTMQQRHYIFSKRTCNLRIEIYKRKFKVPLWALKWRHGCRTWPQPFVLLLLIYCARSNVDHAESPNDRTLALWSAPWAMACVKNHYNGENKKFQLVQLFTGPSHCLIIGLGKKMLVMKW